MKEITTPLTEDQIRDLRAGDEVALTGFVYTARDQAHKRLCEALNNGRTLPIELGGRIVYYCGPTRTPKGRIIGTSTTLSADGEQDRQRRPRRTIGSCGPTTSSRMDGFTPALLDAGLSGMIGKGARSPGVIAAIKKHGAVYFLTYAGCGALLARYVTAMEPVAYRDLGPEAIYRLEVKDFPLIVGVDSAGRSIY